VQENIAHPVSILGDHRNIKTQGMNNGLPVNVRTEFHLGDHDIYDATGDGTDHEENNKADKKNSRDD
jgi:hypothetical protein